MGKTAPLGEDLKQMLGLTVLRFISIQPNRKCTSIYCTSILLGARDANPHEQGLTGVHS